MNRLTAAIIQWIPHIHGWQLKATDAGSILLTNPSYPRVEIYATPGWIETDTLTITVESNEGDHVRSATRPFSGEGDDYQIAMRWSALVGERLWPDIILAVGAATRVQDGDVSSAELVLL